MIKWHSINSYQGCSNTRKHYYESETDKLYFEISGPYEDNKWNGWCALKDTYVFRSLYDKGIPTEHGQVVASVWSNSLEECKEDLINRIKEVIINLGMIVND